MDMRVLAPLLDCYTLAMFKKCVHSIPTVIIAWAYDNVYGASICWNLACEIVYILKK